MATVRAQRIKEGATMENYRDQRRGFPLGKYAAKGLITDEEFDAGCRWGNIVDRYARLNGIPLHQTPKAVDLLAVKGLYNTADDNEAVMRVKRIYDDAFAALCAVGHDERIALNECCVRDTPVILHLLLPGLRVLVDHFGIATIKKAC